MSPKSSELPEAVDDNIIGKEPVSGQNLHSDYLGVKNSYIAIFLHRRGLEARH